jgi:N-methylhydantoinase B
MEMTNRDIFAVTWQGGGGWGDPIEREPETVVRDLAAGWISPQAASEIYGVVAKRGKVDVEATDAQRRAMRERRVGRFVDDETKFIRGEPIGSISESLLIARDPRGTHVVTRAGYILSTNSTRWRSGAIAATFDTPPPEYRIALHEGLSMTAYYCPASGTLLTVDVHERGAMPPDDVVLDLRSAENACA